MPKVIHTTEHELKQGLDEKTHYKWIDKLSPYTSDAEIVLTYCCDEKFVIEKNLSEVAKNLPTQNRVLVYGECLEKGGGGEGIIPTVVDIAYYSIILAVSVSATTFISEFTKDTYKKFFRKLFLTSKKTRLNKKLAIRLTTRNSSIVEYIFNSSLSFNEAVTAFRLIPSHFKKVKRKKFKKLKFIYDRKDGTWVLE